MIGGQVFNPGMGGGASAPLPRTQQGGSASIQQNAQAMVPNQGQFNGNPNGAFNQGFMGQGSAPAWQQQTNLGRYRPPTMRGGNGQWNSNVWNDFGGYDYNLPGSYGSPMGQGQFAPMLNQFRQQFGMAGMSPNFFGMGNPFGGFGMGRRQAPMPGMGEFAQPGDDYDRVLELYQQRLNNQPTPPGKDGNPLPAPMPVRPPRPPQTGGTTGMMPDPEGGLQNAPVAPMPRFSGRGAVEGFGGPDSEEARFRNLSALRAMMGGRG